MKRILKIFFLLLIITISLLVIFCRKINIPNILLVTIDTLRADALSCYNKNSIATLNIDSLAQEGTLFKQAISPVPITLPAHTSLMTCTFPSFHQVHHNTIYKLSNNLTTLAEILQQNGFKTAAFIGAFPLSSTFNINQGFNYYDENFDQYKKNEYFYAERNAEIVLTAASKWIKQNKLSKWFIWIHLFDPHQPYSPPYPFNKIYKNNLYLGEVAYVDYSLGNFFNFLKKEKIFNNLFIILTSDHGEAFGEHNEVNHSTFIYDTTLHIPLIIKTNKSIFKNKIVNNQVSLVDIMPTVLEFLNIKIPDFCQGKSLLSYIKGNNKNSSSSVYIETYAPFLDYNWSSLIGWRSYPWKYIKAPKEELYKLDTDPFEMNNLINSYPNIAKQMRKELSIFLSKEREKQLPFLSLKNKDLERLKALGYIAFSKKNTYETNVFNNKDPKDYANVAKEIAFLNSANLPLPILIERYKKLLSLDKENPLINFRLAYALYKNQDYPQAEILFQSLIKSGYTNADIYLGYAASLLKQNKIPEAFNTLKEAISYNMINEQIYYNLAEIYYAKDNKKEALKYYRLSLKMNPDFQPAKDRIRELALMIK